jgi:polyphosphate kinase
MSLPGTDGLSPGEQLAAISLRVRKMVDDKYRIWNEELVPALAQKLSGTRRRATTTSLGPNRKRHASKD